MGKVILLLIDPQIDFHEDGKLAVPGAKADSSRIAAMIKEHEDKIDEIFVTLDSHHENHIAHAVFWKNREGDSPINFTEISHKDVEDKLWEPRDPALYDHCLHYTRRLEGLDDPKSKNKYPNEKFKLTIWPQHCLIGSHGHSVYPLIQDALMTWVDHKLKSIEYVLKGILM